MNINSLIVIVIMVVVVVAGKYSVTYRQRIFYEERT